MPLDFTILNHDGFPEKSISIGVDLHHQLMLLINKSFGLKLLKRMQDYYEDADFLHEELNQLIGELESLISDGLTGDVQEKLHQMIRLSREALTMNKGISVIAD